MKYSNETHPTDTLSEVQEILAEKGTELSTKLEQRCGSHGCARGVDNGVREEEVWAVGLKVEFGMLLRKREEAEKKTNFAPEKRKY